MKRWKFRLSGSGGQGLITAGIILGEAAVIEGKEVVQSQSYGPEARGGASKAEVIIDDKKINYPKVVIPEVLLAMSQEAADKYGTEIEDNGLIIIDSSMVNNFKNDKAKIVNIPITKLAKEEIGKTFVANIIAISALVNLTKVVSFDSLKQAVLNRIPKGTEDINLKALEIGWKWAQSN
ncbi:MAG: 2-oxoglutarate ferredoxin oxidoreductase subunit gamma [Clostridia bacterium]|jgi:2-oxoglutarate ferredoxin oxidoreductase subunit gamma|nr:2-oxoglutarate ferredoxin oxidoreductase subunit gamma [Clostridia bacterium]MDN5323390.1 2-oxoglutarate ferredoxin oxidoreductase subunit gamma [Clostridia bacterium]